LKEENKILGASYSIPNIGSRSYRQHYALIPFCSALPLEKGRTPMLSATPWITNSTTVQNIVIIAIVSKLQCKSSYISLQPFRYTAESIVAMSLHLHHVPQADMLEYRLEILLNMPLAIDTYLVAVVKRLYYMIFGWWIS
jgi:hypothetical protein